ncbi:glutamine amidotransferase [Vulgatibacter sp.]|uniref:glutamine amidotransferase n=1 Tax=Vulgatibacter sp. TaxID=1971226 RepID=UPI00356AFD5C
MVDEIYNDWRLVSLSPWPAWALVLLGLAALAGVALAWWGLRRENRPWRRRGLVTLRTLSMAAALFVVLEPGIRLLQTSRVKNRLAVLVDGSASMAFPADAAGPTRAAVAGSYLQQVAPELAELAERYTLEFHRFDGDLSPADLGVLQQAPEPKGEKTDLLGALETAAGGGNAAGRKLVGALVLSDGGDNVDLQGGIAGAAREKLEKLQIPVSTVAVGGGSLQDLAVETVKVEDFAFVRNTVEVQATLTASEMQAIDVPVTLRREGQVVAQQTVRIEPGKREHPVRFRFTPDQIGEFVFTVAAPVYEGEAIRSNNSRSFVLKVIRDRVRTLLVVGRPSWDERYLRMLLKTDPNVDLISFFILRTPQDNPRAQEHELSLIPFPVEEIFDKQLKSFDLVVFQNFAYRPYRMEGYLPNIRKYVEEGGAFVMVGGENSFGEGGYQSSPLAEMIPVDPAGSAPNEQLFLPRLTEDGLRHPITQLAASPEANQQTWASLPQLPGVNVTRPKDGAQVLLDHPHLTVGGVNAPVLAVREYGRGRAMALTTDASWYWSLVAAGQSGGSSRTYERIWSNAIRWLVRDPELTPVRVQVVQDTVEPGQPVAATITARRTDYGPADGAEVQVQLVDAETGRVVGAQRLATGPDGMARAELEAPGPGAFKVKADASLAGAALGSGEDAVAVRAASAERSDARPRPDLLRAISDVTGGGHVEAASGSLPPLGLSDPEVVEVGRAKDRPIWDRWWALAALACCLSGEWVLRRRWGYF